MRSYTALLESNRSAQIRTENYAKAMVEDIKHFIHDLKVTYNELRDCTGKIPAVQLQSKIDLCAAALKLYDEKVTPLKKAMAVNKPKKAKNPRAKAAPQASAVVPAAPPQGPAS